MLDGPCNTRQLCSESINVQSTIRQKMSSWRAGKNYWSNVWKWHLKYFDSLLLWCLPTRCLTMETSFELELAVISCLPFKVKLCGITWVRTGVDGMNRDGRGRCMQEKVSSQNCRNKDWSGFLGWSNLAFGRCKWSWEVCASVRFFPSCPMKEAFKASCFTSGHEIMRNFIEQFVVPIMKKRKTLPVSASLKRAVLCAAWQRGRISKMFRSSWN